MDTIRMHAVRRSASVLLALAALLAMALAPAARAADPPVPITSGAGADWGVKTSFRNYIRSPIARGSITLSDGATQNADGTFHFPVAGGEHDPATKATVVRFAGTVHFTGHAGQLDMIVRAPRVAITPEGAALHADVTSKSLAGGALVEYPNVHFADLADDAATPVVDATTTTWPALPARLTAVAVPAFAEFYAAGTELDAFSFAYDGPGGKPQAEDWTAPGTPLVGIAGSSRVAGGIGALAWGVGDLWAASYDRRSLSVLDPADLSVSRTVDVGHNARNVAVHRASRTAYSVDADIRRVTETDGALALDPDPLGSFGGGASNEIAVRQSDGAVFSVEQDLANQQNILHRWAPDGDGPAVHDTWPVGVGYSRVLVGHDDRVYLYGGALAAVRFDDAGEATVVGIPGTEGASTAAVTADGAIHWGYADASAYPTITYWSKVTRPTSGGYETEALPAGDRLGAIASAVAPDGSRWFAAGSNNRDVLVHEDGELISRVVGPDLINTILTTPEGAAFALWRDGTVARLGQTGTSPAITAQPQDAATELYASGAPRDVTFTVAATGEPAPAVQWQQRAPGGIAWSDVAGATEATLTVSATAALTGTRYRAVLGNAAGRLASAPATLTVTVGDIAEPDPGRGGPDPGTGDPDPGTGTPDPGTGNPDPGTGTPPAGPPATPSGPSLPNGPNAPAPPRGGSDVGRPAAAPVAPASGTQRVNRAGVVRVATLACTARRGSCAVRTPRRVRVRIAGRVHYAKVIAPKRVKAGARATVRLRLPRSALRQLGARRARARVKLTVATGDARVTRTAAITIAGPRSARR